MNFGKLKRIVGLLSRPNIRIKISEVNIPENVVIVI